MKNIILVLIAVMMTAGLMAQEAGEVGNVEGKIDVALAIEKLMPKADYSGSVTAKTKEAYDKIEWKSDTPKPSWEELQAAYIVVKQEQDEIKVKAQYKKKVDKEMRLMAIERLKAKGEVPSDYTEE